MKHFLQYVLVAALLLPFSLQAQTARTILLEEFSGNWCGHCPKGADTIAVILNARSDVRVLSYHGGQSEPLRTPEGDTVIAKVTPAYPQAMIDRVIWYDGTNYFRCASRSAWRPLVDVRGSGTAQHLSPCTIAVSGTYNPNTRDISVTADVTPLVDMTGEYYINMVLSEDNISLAQTFYPPTGGTTILDPYYQQHVVRKMITGGNGELLTLTGLIANQAVQHTSTFTIPAWWDVLELHLTVFVSRMLGINYLDIQQTVQEPMLTLLTTTPVELRSFLAQTAEDGIRVTWTTTAEQNNKGWYIERTSDGETWSAIDFVNGRGTTNEDFSYVYTDKNVEYGNLYTYRLKQMDYDGSFEYSPKITVAYDAAPATTALHQNYPNPFNPSTEISVDLAADAHIQLEIYDVMGRLVSTLADGFYTKGTASFTWNATNTSGIRVPAGMYYYRLTTPASTITKQMMLTK